MLEWAWRGINNRKHLIVEGKVACSASGLPSDAAVACKQCVDILLKVEKAVFLGDPPQQEA
jgi:hypothetical protein